MYCAAEGEIGELHAHLRDSHGDRVRIEEQADRVLYVVECPACGSCYRKPMKKGDAAFVEEFGDVIRLVAFDMLLNHVLAEHAE